MLGRTGSKNCLTVLIPASNMHCLCRQSPLRTYLHCFCVSVAMLCLVAIASSDWQQGTALQVVALHHLGLWHCVLAGVASHALIWSALAPTRASSACYTQPASRSNVNAKSLQHSGLKRPLASSGIGMLANFSIRCSIKQHPVPGSSSKIAGHL